MELDADAQGSNARIPRTVFLFHVRLRRLLPDSLLKCLSSLLEGLGLKVSIPSDAGAVFDGVQDIELSLEAFAEPVVPVEADKNEGGQECPYNKVNNVQRGFHFSAHSSLRNF